MAKTDLTEFLTNVKRKNLARSNHFRIEIDIPTGLLTKFQEANFKATLPDTINSVSLFCYFAQFPSTNIQVNSIFTYGTPFWQPSLKIMDRLYIGVYLDQKFMIKRFFDAWVDLVFDPVTSHLNFREDYATTIKLYQLDSQMEPVYGVQFNDVFPTYVEPISVHYSDRNKVSTLTTQFTFKDWTKLDVDYFRDNETDFGILGDIPEIISKGYNIYSFAKNILKF